MIIRTLTDRPAVLDTLLRHFCVDGTLRYEMASVVEAALRTYIIIPSDKTRRVLQSYGFVVNDHGLRRRGLTGDDSSSALAPLDARDPAWVDDPGELDDTSSSG